MEFVLADSIFLFYNFSKNNMLKFIYIDEIHSYMRKFSINILTK